MPVSLFSNTKNQELVVLFLDKDKKFLSPLKDKVLSSFMEPAVKDFSGELKATNLVYIPKHPLTKRVLLVGVGEKSALTGYCLRSIGAVLIEQARKLKLEKNISVILPKLPKFKTDQIVEELETGAGLFKFTFEEFKTEKGKKKPATKNVVLSYVVDSSKEKASASKAFDRAQVIAEGVNFGRDLIMLSGRQLYPAELMKRAHAMAKDSVSSKKIKIKSMGQKDLEKSKYGGILCVGQGSANDSVMIVLEYQGAAKSQAPTILVGKGVTFDSGGLSLKPGPMMETMKYDMGGAGSVLAAFKIATDLQLKMNLVCIVPSAENMPSGTAQRPGDIVTMADGQTVEVLNTDAEGRLILADALYHASTKYKPKQIIDVATLTGACAIAVGDAAAGAYTNNDKLLSKFQKAADSSEEYIWPLPNFPRFYDKLIKSDVADIRNTGTIREAGSTTAAMFLESFVHNDCDWIHLDIAGCGWYNSPKDYVGMRGSSGVPIRLLVEFLENNK